MQDVAGEKPADGEPFEVVLRNRVPMFDGTEPPLPFELTVGVVAELVEEIKQRDGEGKQQEDGLNVLSNFESPWFSVKCEDIWGFSSAGRAPALQAGGHRFDPGNLHHVLERGLHKEALKEPNNRHGLIAQPVRAHA